MSVRLGTFSPRRKKGSRRGSPDRCDALESGQSLALRGPAALGGRLGPGLALGLLARRGALGLLLGRSLLLRLLLLLLGRRGLLLGGLRRLLRGLDRRGRRALCGLRLALLGRRLLLDEGGLEAHEFDDRHLGVVAPARPELQDPGVATRTLGE